MIIVSNHMVGNDSAAGVIVGSARSNIWSRAGHSIIVGDNFPSPSVIVVVVAVLGLPVTSSVLPVPSWSSSLVVGTVLS